MEENQIEWDKIGERLSQARKKKGLKQIEAAEKLDLLQSNLSAIENGKAKLSTEVLLKACKLYNVFADSILFNREVKATNEYMDELEILAVRYSDILFKLDMLQSQKDLEEIKQHLDGLLMPD